jgi:site-specific recombinase XerD
VIAPSTLGDSYRHYLNHADLNSAHTLAAYSRSIELFFQFLADRNETLLLPIQARVYTTPEEIELHQLTQDDQPIFLRFAKWLQVIPKGQVSRNDKRPYARATVELRLAGVLNWFQYMDKQGWLPNAQWLQQASAFLRDYLNDPQAKREKQIAPPPDLQAVVTFFDSQSMPSSLKSSTDAAKIELWETKRLRNRALLYCLAETGGRISEVLSLNMEMLPARRPAANNPVLIEVIGKGGHRHTLRLQEALAALYDYLKERAKIVSGGFGGQAVFISHDPRYQGSRMSRIVAWRVVHRAANAVGFPDISPQDFRHWRALQLLGKGASPQEVQAYLGHRSIDTVRSFYASTDPET